MLVIIRTWRSLCHFHLVGYRLQVILIPLIFQKNANEVWAAFGCDFMFKGIRNSTEHLLLHNRVNMGGQTGRLSSSSTWVSRCVFSLGGTFAGGCRAENDPPAIQVCTSGPHAGTNYNRSFSSSGGEITLMIPGARFNQNSEFMCCVFKGNKGFRFQKAWFSVTPSLFPR